MAIKEFVIECDHCEEVGHSDLQSGGEATEQGWLIVNAAERIVGGDGEVTFCCEECLITFFSCPIRSP